MEGIYQSSLYSANPAPYVLPPSNHQESSFQHSHYGNQYRSSAFSDARSCQSATNPYHSPLQHHSAGLNVSNSYGHSHGDINHHHDTHNNHTTHNNAYHSTHYTNHGNNNTASSSAGWSSPSIPWNSSPPPLPPPSRMAYNMPVPIQRPKLTTTLWEDEGTMCYQVDAKSVCVARRHDNDMINGTKLLNVVGMSRGKRDGILKNEKGRVVVKVGAMHLKGVWITFSRAKDLASKFKIADILYPLFVDDPSVFLAVPTPSATGLPIMLPTSSGNNARSGNLNLSHYGSYSKHETNNFLPFGLQSWEKQPCQSLPSITSQQQDQMAIRSQGNHLQSGSCSPVPGSIAPVLSNEENDIYLLNNTYEYRSSLNRSYGNMPSSSSHPYNMYTTDNTSSPGHHFSYETSSSGNASNNTYNMASSVNRKSQSMDEKPETDSTEKSARIDYPNSPPPESENSNMTSHSKMTQKFSSSSAYHSNHASPSSWPETNTQPLTEVESDKKNASVSGPSFRTSSILMSHGRSSLEHPEEKSPVLTKGRKRIVEKSSNLQRRRIKIESDISP